MSEHYVLGASGEPVATDLMTWALWLETNRESRRVGYDELDGGVRVSTVFLGLDHSFGGAVPVLWETMIFNGPHNQYQERYTSRADAIEGHTRALAIAKNPDNPGAAP